MSCPMGYGQQEEKEKAGNGSTPTKKRVASSDAPDSPARNKRKVEDAVYYGDYLQLDSILNAQKPLSRLPPDNEPAHEEMLFIIVHQTYELWFKQILHEIASVIDLFSQDPVPDFDMGIIVNRLERVTEIQKILVTQIRVLETMFPMDFMTFRDFLVPASGFQSRQFRDLENRLGLQSDMRRTYQSTDYKDFFSGKDQDKLKHSEKQSTLFDVVEMWLERTPFVKAAGFDFWTEYEKASKTLLERQEADVRSNPFYDDKDTLRNLKELEKARADFEVLFDEKRYAESVAKTPSRHFSYKAMQAAILISLYKNEPIFQVPYRVLHLLTDIDQYMCSWRNAHASMVQRMIGVKVGTGGSSGYHYLRTTVTDRYKVFVDLCNMATYLLPHQALPDLPYELRRAMTFAGGVDPNASSSRRSSTASNKEKEKEKK